MSRTQSDLDDLRSEIGGRSICVDLQRSWGPTAYE
jgi:hypothetical protein